MSEKYLSLSEKFGPLSFGPRCLFNGPQLSGNDTKKKRNFAGITDRLTYYFINRDHCIMINTCKFNIKYFDASS